MASWIRGGLLVAVAAGAEMAEAGDLVLGADMRLGYDSNIFSRESGPDELDSGVFALSAFAEATDSLEKGSYKLRYRPTFFINEADRADNTWNHEAHARGSYNFSPRTSVTLSDDFAFLEKLTFIPSNDTVNPDFDDQARRTIRNSSTVQFSHMLTRRLSAFGTGTYTIYRYSRANDEDNDHLSGNASMNYAISRQLRVGAGGSARYSSFDGDDNIQGCFGDDRPGSRSFSYSGFVSGSYQYDETTNLRVQAGPAKIASTSFLCSLFLIDPNQPPLPGNLDGFFRKETTSQITWFAEGQISKNWEHVKVLLRYRRSEGLGAVGTSTINDSVTANFNWQPARYWNFSLQGGWIRRTQEQAKNPTINRKNTIDTTTWTASTKISRQLLERLRASVTASYRKQEEDRSLPQLQQNRDFDAWRVFVGLSYQLDPIRY